MTVRPSISPPTDRPASAATPTVSVVIPTHGRPGKLLRCLEALELQTLPKHHFEVVVSDDGSPEPVAPVVSSFAERLTVRVVRRARSGPAAARNEGARKARGRYLAFTDDDCVPPPDWLARVVERLRRHPGHLIGGPIVNLLPDDPYATATQLIQSSVYDYYSRHDVGHRFFSTSNLSVSAHRFWLLDGFSEQFRLAAGEDYDFCARWQEAGFPAEYAPEVEIGHAHGHTLRSFWMQHFCYGRGLLRVREGMARRRGRSGIELEAPNFYRQILTYPIRHSERRRVIRNMALVVLSQVATLAGAVREVVFGREAPEVPSGAAQSPVDRLPDRARVTTTR